MPAVLILLMVIGLLVVPLECRAQSPSSPGEPSKAPVFETPRVSSGNAAPRGPGNVSGPAKLLSNYEFALSLIVLAFGCVVVVAQYRLMSRRSVGPDDIVRMFAVTLIIIGTLFAVTAGFSSEQIAPAMGLFGTIAGYLLGR